MQRKLNLPKEVLEYPIEDLDLSVRSYNALNKRHISTLSELLTMTDAEMLELPFFGKKCLAIVHEAIEQFLASRTADSGEEKVGEIFEAVPGSSLESHLDPEKLKWTENGWLLPETIICDLDAPLEILDLTARPTNVFSRREIRTIRQLLSHSVSSIKHAKSMGRKSMAEVQAKLLQHLSGRQDETSEFENVPEQSTEQSLGTKAFVRKFLSPLSGRQQDVIADRYRLWDGVTETLQVIGDKYGLTRERIRQIEAKSLRRLSHPHRRSKLRRFISHKLLDTSSQNDKGLGMLNKDEVVLALADDCTFEEATLAVTLMQDIDGLKGDFFARCLAKVEEDVYCAAPSRAAIYDAILELVKKVLEERKKPVAEASLADAVSLRAQVASIEDPSMVVQRVLTLSPSVARLKNGTVVLAEWTNFRRRDITSLTESALMVLGRPAHFNEIARKIESMYPELCPIDERQVHNRLVEIREKFVRVRSGTYGLKAWGLKRPPYLKDRLIELLSDSNYPLSYRYLKEKSLEVCNCREASVQMTLDLNPKVFKKFADNQYGLRKNFESSATQS